MGIFILSVLAAAIPTLFYIALIYWVDHYEKEPVGLLVATFLWGAVPSILAALIFNTLFSLPAYYLGGQIVGDAFGAVILAPLVEESLKGLAVLGILLLWRHEIDSILDGIIYGAMVGLGFAMVENIFYFMSAYADGGVNGWTANIFLRSLFGLNHSLFAAMTGMGIAYFRIGRGPLRYAAPFLGLGAGMFLHFIHNLSAVLTDTVSGLFCLVLPINAWGGVGVTLLIIVWALRQERQWIRAYLEDEVALQTLTPEQFATAASGLRRLRHQFALLSEQGWREMRAASRFYHHCSELAYKKRHQAHFHDAQSARIILELRDKVRLQGSRLV